jgi:hypothetical protein
VCISSCTRVRTTLGLRQREEDAATTAAGAAARRSSHDCHGWPHRARIAARNVCDGRCARAVSGIFAIPRQPPRSCWLTELRHCRCGPACPLLSSARNALTLERARMLAILSYFCSDAWSCGRVKRVCSGCVPQQRVASMSWGAIHRQLDPELPLQILPVAMGDSLMTAMHDAN